MDRDSLTGLPIGPQVEALSAGWPDAQKLEGRYVRLEALDADRHSRGLWETTGGEAAAALWQYMPEGPFLDREQFDAALQDAEDHDDPVFFVIVDNASNRLVGRCSLLNIRPKHRVIEVGHIVFSHDLQRTPAATETIYLLAKYIFEDLAYRRYEWKCNSLNEKSRSAAVRFGFQFEGIFRQHMIVKGRSRDSAWFSMLAGEWPSIRAAMEAWLAPANFDHEGKQREKLSDLMKLQIRDSLAV